MPEFWRFERGKEGWKHQSTLSSKIGEGEFTHLPIGVDDIVGKGRWIEPSRGCIYTVDSLCCDIHLVCKYFLHSEKIIQMPLNWANCNQSKIWFCQIKIQEICNPTYFYQFFMSGWLPAIKWHWKKVAWSKLDKVSKNMAIIYSKWKLFCQKGIKLTPF